MVRERPPATATPFAGAPEPATFHAGPAQQEALARLEWLAEERQRCGLVVAAAGMGKSHLLAVAARRLGGLGAEVAMLSLRGMPEGDWLELLLERLPLHPLSRAEPIRPWRKLEQRLRENALLERTTALFFDDVDHGPADALEGITRLVSAAEPLFSRTLVVVTATRPAGVPEAIMHRAAVRTELAAWSERETTDYLAAEMIRVGADPATFTPEAMTTLARFAGGTPRVATQLARLALAAASGDRVDQVDAAMVERVWRELAPAPPGEMPAARDDRAATEECSTPPIVPRVRVVRRLWG